MDIKLNITNLKRQISALCKEYDRRESDVKIVAVSKTKPIAMIKQAMAGGLIDFGENYVQEAEEKYDLLKEAKIKWHFIGGLQSNKVKSLTKFCSLLHSLDRESLAEALQKRLEVEGRTMDALIQINTSGEATKSGAAPKDALHIARIISGFDRIKIKGLMTIAENTDDKNSVRKNYKHLKQLFEEVKALDYSNFEMRELSMGMSSDYDIAIEEGATIIRIGSTIFGKREAKKPAG